VKNKNHSESPLAFRMVEAATLLGVSLRTLQTLVSSKEVRSLLIGRIRLIRKKSLEDFLRRREKQEST
jgi:excisionase family DNA binding protein